MSDPERIVAIGLLSQRDLDALGSRFTRAYPLSGDGDVDFSALLDEIDRAEVAYQSSCKD